MRVSALLKVVVLVFALIGLGLPVPSALAAPKGGGGTTSGGSGLNVKIQGFDKVSKSWTSGNTAGYAETEKIPFRISLENGSAATTVDSIETVYDHERSGVQGIENLFDFYLCEGSLTKTWTAEAPGANGPCTLMLVYSQGTVPAGTAPYITFDGFRSGSGGTTQGVYTWHRISIPAGATRTLTWGAKLAIGSHLYNGSALHMQIGSAVVNGGTVSFGSKDVPIPVNAILATETDKKINGSDGPVSVNLNDEVRVTIVAKAFGPSNGTQTLVVTDTLPACLTFVRDDPSVAGTPTLSNGDKTVTYTFSNVKNGTSVTAAFYAKATSVAAGTSCTNLAVTDSQTPNVPDSQDTVVITVAGKPALMMEKTCPDTAAPGATVECTLEVSNAGTATAHDVKAIDDMDPRLVYTNTPVGTTSSPVLSPAIGDPTVSTVNGKTRLQWSIGDLAAGDTLTITFHVRIPGTSTTAGEIQYGDIGTATTPDGPPSPPDEEIITVTYTPDLNLTKQCSAPAEVGSNVTMTLTYGNSGTADAHNVVVTDTLPAGLTFVSSVPAKDSGSSSTSPTWTFPTLAAGTTNQTITLTVAVSGQGAQVNNASIDSDETGPETAQCTQGVNTPDVYITKQCPSAATAGATVTHTLSFGNSGTAAANGVVITDSLSGQTFVSGSAQVKYGSGSFSSIANGGSSTSLSFNIGTLAAGTTGVLTYSVLIPASSSSAGSIVATDQASISTTSAGETNLVNNTSDVCRTTVKYEPKLDLDKDTACPIPSAVPGQVVVYTLKVTNSGSSPASNVVLTDTVPTGTTVVNAGGGTVSSDGKTVTWTVSSLGVGASFTKTLKVKVTSEVTNITNTASVIATGVSTATSDSVSTPVDLSGRATSGSAYDLTVGVLNGAISLGPVNATSSSATSTDQFDETTKSLPSIAVPGLVSVGLLKTNSKSTVGVGSAKTVATSEIANVDLLSGAVKISAVKAVSTSEAGPTMAAGSAAGSTFTGLQVNGKTITDVYPGMTVDVYGKLVPIIGPDVVIARLHLWEETKTADDSGGKYGATNSIVMARLVVIENLPLLGVTKGAEVVIGQAQSSAVYPQGLECGETHNTVKGEAYTAKVNALGGTGEVTVSRAHITKLGGSDAAGADVNAVNGVVTLVTSGTTTNTVTGSIYPSPPSSSAHSRVEGLALTLPGLTVTADVLDVTSDSVATGSSAGTTYGFQAVNLKINGTAVSLPIGPNTTLDIPSGGALIHIVLNERINGPSNSSTTEGRINALHVQVLKGTVIETEVIVSSAFSGATKGAV